MNKYIKKTVIINRAVPGSGKTTISNCVVQHLNEIGISVKVHSTDDFFMTDDNRYNFQIEKLFEFHTANFNNFIESLNSNIPIVICDNTNITPWQTKPYTDAARQYGYKVIFMTFSPREIQKHIESQLVTPEKPDAHGVSEAVLISFIDEYIIYNPLLDKSFPINQNVHKNYFWDSISNTRLPSNKPSPHFDADEIIEIMPHQYHDMKNNIGKIIHALILIDGGTNQ